MLNKLKNEIARMVADSSQSKADEVLPTIEYGKMGDLSCKFAFVLAKEKNENPAKLAAEISSRIKLSDNFSKAESAGPYINFYLSNKAYALLVSGSDAEKTMKGKVIIEFPAVNPNKPWHIGHLRNAILGESVARILEIDHEVVRMDYINDLGLQVAQSLWGYLNNDAKPDKKFDQWLGEQYVYVAKKFEEDPEVAKQVRLLISDMEGGVNDNAVSGRELAEKCVRAQYQTALDFGVTHDVLIFESDIMRTIFEEGIDKLKSGNSVFMEKEGKNKGCLVVDISGDLENEFGKMENPNKILIRSDGTAVYTGKDVIFHLWKFGKIRSKFKYEKFMDMPEGVALKSSKEGESREFADADLVINVIGVEQKYPQRVIVEVLKKLGYAKEASSLHHLSYEHVGLPESKFSGRKGTWMGFTADDLLSEAKERVLEKITIDATPEEKGEISHMVAVASIKFAFLRSSSDKKITFRWESALNLEGDSGPYAQYAYVRTNGILEKAKDKPEACEIEFNESEKRLIKRLSMFNDLVDRCSKELAPHHLTQYVLDVAGDFSAFYSSSPVINENDDAKRKTRLAITKATQTVLGRSLHLLGIRCPSRM